MSTAHAAVLLLSLVTMWIGVRLAVRLPGNARAIDAGVGFSTGIMLLISTLELVPRRTGSASHMPVAGPSLLDWQAALSGDVAERLV